VKRGVFDVLLRALDNTVANWQLVLVRFGESVVLAILAVLSAVVIIAPILISIGINIADITSPEDFEGVAELLLSRWALLIWVVVAVSVLLAVFVALHSLVEAGSARVYIDGDRIAGPEKVGPRSRFKVFSMERWWAGAKDGWWTVFWIYNLAWGAASVILLLPLLPTLVLVLLLRDDEQPLPSIAVGCVGLAITLLLFLVVAVVTAVWTNRAITDWAIRRAGARDALAAGWAAMRADLLRHVLIAVALYVVLMAGSSFFATLSMFGGFGDVVGKSSFTFLFTLPLRLFTTALSYAFTAAVTSWFLSSYATLANEQQ
jgi:hypothetical protein